MFFFFFIIYSCQFKFFSPFFKFDERNIRNEENIKWLFNCCKEWCASVWIVKWTGPWSSLDKWKLCTCRCGDLLLSRIRQPKQNISSIWLYLWKISYTTHWIKCARFLWVFIDNCSNSHVFMRCNIYCLLSTLPMYFLQPQALLVVQFYLLVTTL